MSEQNLNTPAENPKINGVSNSTQPSTSEENRTAIISQAQPEVSNLNKPSKWRIWWNRAKTMWLLFGEAVTILWCLALWDSYRPKITVVPGGSTDSKSPFGTFFILQNNGALSIANIRYLTRLTMVPVPGVGIQSTNVVSTEQNVTVIPQMKSLESYSFSIHKATVGLRAADAGGQVGGFL